MNPYEPPASQEQPSGRRSMTAAVLGAGLLVVAALGLAEQAIGYAVSAPWLRSGSQQHTAAEAWAAIGINSMFYLLGALALYDGLRRRQP